MISGYEANICWWRISVIDCHVRKFLVLMARLQCRQVFEAKKKKICLAKADTQLNDLHKWTTRNDTKTFYVFKTGSQGSSHFFFFFFWLLHQSFYPSYCYFRTWDWAGSGIWRWQQLIIFSTFRKGNTIYTFFMDETKRLTYKIRTTQIRPSFCFYFGHIHDSRTSYVVWNLLRICCYEAEKVAQEQCTCT